MAALLFNGLAVIFALDAAFLAALAGARVTDPVALRTASAMAGTILGCGAVCLIAARIA